MSIAERSAGRLKAGLLLVLLGALLSGCAGVGTQLFDATDRQVIAATTQQVLEYNKTGEGKNWVNPETDHRGTVTPTRTFQQSGRPCREFQQTATTEGHTYIAYDIACRRGDGNWQSQNYAGLDGAINDAPYYRDRRHYDPYCDDYRYDPFHYSRDRFGWGYPYGPCRRFGPY